MYIYLFFKLRHLDNPLWQRQCTLHEQLGAITGHTSVSINAIVYILGKTSAQPLFRPLFSLDTACVVRWFGGARHLQQPAHHAQPPHQHHSIHRSVRPRWDRHHRDVNLVSIGRCMRLTSSPHPLAHVLEFTGAAAVAVNDQTILLFGGFNRGHTDAVRTASSPLLACLLACHACHACHALPASLYSLPVPFVITHSHS